MPRLTDDDVLQLAQRPELTHLDLSGSEITDRALAVLRELPALETLSLAGTRVTDKGIAELAHCHELREVDLSWTRTGDAALRALAGKRHLRVFASGNGITDDGLGMLHELPVFKTWQGGEVEMALLSYRALPNQLVLRGSFTDRGIEAMRGLDGLFGLNLDDRSLSITAAALAPLGSLPHLGWLAVDAKDDWMPAIAAMPRLRFLGAQDTVAGDDGFVALSRSQSIEYLWGRRCHNLRTRGFLALASMPALRGLSVSCLNVDEAGIAALPSFPALRELMPMDVPDDGYRHIGKCEQLESLILMYCRDTTDAATEHITGLRNLTYYFQQLHGHYRPHARAARGHGLARADHLRHLPRADERGRGQAGPPPPPARAARVGTRDHPGTRRGVPAGRRFGVRRLSRRFRTRRRRAPRAEKAAAEPPHSK